MYRALNLKCPSVVWFGLHVEIIISSDVSISPSIKIQMNDYDHVDSRCARVKIDGQMHTILSPSSEVVASSKFVTT